MENEFMHRVSQLFPFSFSSSCNFRNFSDAIKTSIVPPPNPKNLLNVHPQQQQIINKPYEYDRHTIKKKPIINASSKGRCSTNESTAKLTKIMNMSSSSFSTSGLFSSEEEEDECDDSGKIDNFCRFSSGSSQSFYRKTTTTRRRSGDHDISDMGLCSFAGEVATTKMAKSKDQKNTENHDKPSKTTHRKTSKIHRRSTMDHDQYLFTENVNYYYSEFESGRRKTSKTRRRRGRELSSKVGEFWFVVDDGRVLEESSYGVEKSSRDPYSDFRASMVEMIVEKQIVGGEDLERLLHCFLGLNSSCYHEVIVEVFYEVCQTLFTN